MASIRIEDKDGDVLGATSVEVDEKRTYLVTLGTRNKSGIAIVGLTTDDAEYLYEFLRVALGK